MRPTNVFRAAVLMAAAVCLLMLALLGAHEVTWLLLAGALGLLARTVLPGDARVRRWDDASLARIGPPDPRPQLAGSKCSFCAQRIASELEAKVCASCNAPLHRECRKDHRVDAHRAKSGRVYR